MGSRCYCLAISVLKVGVVDASDSTILSMRQKSQMLGACFIKNLKNLSKGPTKGTKGWLVPMAFLRNSLTGLGQLPIGATRGNQVTTN